MKLNNQEYAQAKLGELKPHPRNPRQGDVGAIYQSIEANGFYGAIVAQRSTGYILAGNHRYKAAAEAGAKSVPVIWVDVDDETAVRVLLADNRTNDVASYDNAVLAEILTELASGPGLEGTGYDGDDLDQLLTDLAGDEPKQTQEGADDQSGMLSDTFQVLVICKTESEQADILERLIAEGYECRSLIS